MMSRSHLHATRLPTRQRPPVRPALSPGGQTVCPRGAGLSLCGLEIIVEQEQVEEVGFVAPAFALLRPCRAFLV